MLFTGLGKLLAEILPGLFTEFRKPRKAEMLGEGEETKEKVKSQVKKNIRREQDRVEKLLEEMGK